ncbi:hypothetical protein EZV62_001510 [Acer yangbiense]|uniref:Protein TIC 22-like, chloroplastic n=1 Tax=Acer yangbiense TaxID=1000413 RepID=A0A5C7IUH8_9ROSI|nr:hypothetical protein EZV62_001510 [Acer yangbiense]
MKSSDSNPPQPFSPINQALNNLQTHFSGFLHHLSHLPLLSNKPSISSLQDSANQALHAGFSRLSSCSLPSNGNQVWARIGATQLDLPRQQGAAMSTDVIEERLGEIPVYALSNPNGEFVLVSGKRTGKSLGLLCFKEEDAAALLEEMKTINPSMRQRGSKVVSLDLKKIIRMKVNGVAFRFIPDSTQIKNALQERQKAGYPDDGFPGVPVFQSRSLVLQSHNKRYRPVFFRKEDLQKSLARASRQQNKLNPAFRQGDIQVAVFEEIIKGMKEGTSTWNDVVFVPPGFDVTMNPTPEESSEN